MKAITTLIIISTIIAAGVSFTLLQGVLSVNAQQAWREIQITTTPRDEGRPDIAILDNGDIAIAYESEHRGNFRQAHAQIRGPDGSSIVAPNTRVSFNVQDVWGSEIVGFPSVVGLPDTILHLWVEDADQDPLHQEVHGETIYGRNAPPSSRPGGEANHRHLIQNGLAKWPTAAVDSQTGIGYIIWQDRTGDALTHLWGMKINRNLEPISPPIRLTGSPLVEENPAVAIGPDGILHVVFESDTESNPIKLANKVYYARFTPNFDLIDKQRVPITGQPEAGYAKVAVDEQNTVHIVAWAFGSIKEVPTPPAGYNKIGYVRYNGGRLVRGPVVVDSPQFDVDIKFYPNIATDRQGNAHITWNALKGNGLRNYGVDYAKISPSGSFQIESVTTPPNPPPMNFAGRPSIAVGNNIVYIVYQQQTSHTDNSEIMMRMRPL